MVVLAAVALASPAPVAAQSSGAPAAERATLDEPIDIALKDAGPAEVFASFAHILGLQVAALPAFDRTLTMELHGVRAETVLTAACESLGCAWRIKGDQLVVTDDPDAPAPPSEPGAGAGDAAGPLDEAIDIVLEDADLRETLRSFGTITRARVEIDPALEGRAGAPLHPPLTRRFTPSSAPPP